MIKLNTKVKECHVCGEEKEFYATGSRCIDCMKEYQKKIDSKRFGKFAQQYNVPMKCVYGIYDPQGELVYIGESSQAPVRLETHLGKRGPGLKNKLPNRDTTGYTYKVLWSGENEIMRKIQERNLIQIHQPKFNILYKNIK